MMGKRNSNCRRILSFLCAGLLLAGCAAGADRQDTPATETLSGDVTLLEPEGTASNYEYVSYKNLYKSEVYSASVDFPVTEYAYPDNQTFTRLGVLPGNSVSAGEALIYGSSRELEKQIENKQKSIEKQEEDEAEYVEIANENLEQPLEDKEFYYRLCQEYKDREPEFTLYGTKYQDVNIEVQLLQEELKQHTELYELDHNYALEELQRLQDRKEQTILKATASGTVVAITGFVYGDQIASRTPVIAVGNLDQKKIHCDFISKAEITKAADVYAFFDGKRYEIEYEPMKTEEYNKRVRNESSLYSTFRLTEDSEELKTGDYGVVVMVSDKREHVLAVSKDAIHKDGDGNFVYCLADGNSVYTPVVTGMTDGVYTEIVSGLKEGDRVLSGNTMTADKQTMKLEKGSIGNSFEAAAYLYYPSYEIVSNPIEYGTCYYVESLVRNNQLVKKGEVLANVYVIPDEVSLQTKVTRTERIDQRISDLQEKNAKEKDKKKRKQFDREINKLQKEREELQEEIDQMKADYSLKELCSPTDGIVVGMPDYQEERELYQDQTLFMIAKAEQCYLTVKDEGDLLKYGMELTVTYEDKEGKKKTATGKVVTTNGNFLSSEMRTEEVLIRLPEEMIGDMALSTEESNGLWSRSRMDVSCITRQVENILLVPKKAVTMQNGHTYVKVKLDNGDATYMSFVPCGSDQVNYGVAEGLTEGMEICFE